MADRYFETDEGQQTIASLLHGDDLASTSEYLMSVLFNKDEREQLFNQFLAHEQDLSYDWFQLYYSLEMTRISKKKKTYYSPPELGQLAKQLVDVEKTDKDTNTTQGKTMATNYDVGAGTGQLTVTAWDLNRHKHSPFSYKPSMYFYVTEELKEAGKPSRSIPFLLFNYLIRGMDGVVVAGDSLTRSISQVYFIQQPEDDHFKFSSLNVMPRTETVMHEFDVRTWVDEPIQHIEDENIPTFIIDGLTGKQQSINVTPKQADIYQRRLNVIRNLAGDDNGKTYSEQPSESEQELVSFIDYILPGFEEFEAQKRHERFEQHKANHNK